MSMIILEVNEVQRTLKASGAGAFVAHDKEVDIVRFSLMSGFADIALDEHSALRVMYQRPGESQVRAQTLTYYDTDGLHNYYDWRLSQTDLAKSGSLMVALCILDISGGEVSEWHTTPCVVRVLPTIHTDDSDEGDDTITPTVKERVAVLESMIQRVASGAPIVVASASEMTDAAQIYVLSTDGNWYYHNGTAWTAGGEYGAVATDTTLTQAGIPADAKVVGEIIGDLNDLQTAEKLNLVDAINSAAASGSSEEIHALPVLKIYGDITVSNKDAETKAYRYVWENSEEGEQRTGYCSLKWQGESSLTYPKKNYTIKFFHDAKYKRKDKVSLFDELVLKKNKWVIKANWVDRSQAKNVVSCRLWGQMVKSRTTEPESHMKAAPNFGAVNGYPVKVYVNDEWHGLYSFNIPKDEDLFGMEEGNPLHCAVCGDQQQAQSVAFRQASTNGWELEVPDAWASYTVEEEGVEVTKRVADGFTNMIGFVMNSTDEEFKANLNDYLDVESAIDYYLFCYFAFAIDSLGRNLMLVTYDGGNKWYCTLYDADTTWGNGLNGGSSYNSPQSPCPESYELKTSLLWERIEACFGDELWDRWSDLRKTIFRVEYVQNEFNLFWRHITDADYQADIDRWTGVDSTRPYVPQWNVDIRTAIPAFIAARALYCDEQIKAMRTPVSCTGITLDKSEIAFTSGDPISLVATVTPDNTTDDVIWSVSDATIVRVEDGAVYPLKNGTATITATCGSYSATCTATVTALSYSVTLAGDHVSLSDTSDVSPGASYTGTLTTDSGFTVSDIHITMGGTDITSTAYSDGTITIASVTGNIVVTVVTTYEYDTTGLVYRLPSALTVDGQHYIDTGWMYDAASSFTLALDITAPNDISTNELRMLGAKLANGNQFGYDPGYRGFRRVLNQNMMSGAPAVAGDRLKFVLRYNLATQVLSCRGWSYSKKNATPQSTGETTSSYSHATTTGQPNRDAFALSLYLGAKHTDTGAEFDVTSGVIHDCRIYSRRWTDAEVKQWLGVDTLSTVFTDDMDS